MKKSVLSILGGLLLCLPMLFTSCSEKDNSLEQIVNQPNLEGLKKALYTNAEVTVQYTVYGKTDPYTVTLKNVGTVENPKYEVQGELPTDLGYTLKCDLGYENEMLYFGLACGEITANDDDEPEDIFDMSPVMVVRFDTKTSKYEVFALPGFSFKVISINGTEMEVTDASEGNIGKIKFYHGNPYVTSRARTRTSGPTLNLEMDVNMTNATNWGDVDAAYDEVGLGVFGVLKSSDTFSDAMIVDLSDYKSIYFTADGEDNCSHVFEIITSDGVQKANNEVSKEITYSATDYQTAAYLPCYGLNSRGNIALLDVLKLTLPSATPTWIQIVEANSSMLKLVYTSSSKTKVSVVTKDNVINDNGKNYYYGLYNNTSSYRVKAEDEFKVGDNNHFYQLRSSIRESDVAYP